MKSRVKYLSSLWAVWLTFSILGILFVSASTVHAVNPVVIKVGYSDSDGISVDENGTYSGYVVDYLEELSRYTGWEYEYVFHSWKGCMNALEQGEVDLLPMMLYTPERGERFLYSVLDMGTNYMVLYTSPDRNIFYRDYSAFEGCRIGVVSETFFEDILREHIDSLDLNCEIITYSNERALENALSRGEIEILATNIFSSYRDLKMVDRFSVLPSYLVTNRQNQELMGQINTAMQQIEVECSDFVSRLTENYCNTENADLHLTRAEQEYIDSADTIEIRMFNNRHPLIYFEGDGVRGILPDYLDKISQLTGLKFNYVQAETEIGITEVPLLRETGSLLLSSSTAVAAETDLIRTQSMMQLKLAYVKRIRDNADFKPTKFAILHNMSFLEELFPERYTILTYDTVEDCMNAVERGDADMTIQFELVATYLLQRPRYSNNLVEWVGADYFVDIYLYGTGEYETLFRILNKAQEHLSDAERAELVSRSLMNHTYVQEMSDLVYQYSWLILFVVMVLAVLALMLLLRYRTNIGKQKIRENEELQRRLWTDELTGLYNREGFFANTREMFDKPGGDMAIVRVNICRFKQFNEVYGLENGDMILQEVGRRLKQMSEQVPRIIGRFSADRFYLCVANTDLEKLSLMRQIDLPALTLNLNLTYGIYPTGQEEGIPVNLACDRADLANIAALPTEDRYIHYYSDAEHQKLRYEQMMERDMERALHEGQFIIYVQPKYDIETEAIVGGEVLVRWLHPEYGLIPPGKFISLFERNGFIRKLDYFVWEKCCQYAAEMKRMGMPAIPLSFNMSRIHFYGFESIRRLTKLLEIYQLEPGDVELEITESLCAENPDMLFDKCRQLREMGFRIAMDDFGSGYSSLSALKDMPIDILKMDLRFLAGDDEADQADRSHCILRSTIEMAHTIGLDVVVEGLETREQRDFIREIGGCTVQGYYYARPMPADEFTELLRSEKSEVLRLPVSGMAANLRRERLRREQLQPLLELISASENLFGYLLPEKEGVLPWQLAQNLNCPQRTPNLAEYVLNSGILSPGSVPQCMRLVEAAERGARTGAAIVEYANPIGSTELQWVRFDTILDYEGQPLIALFTIEDFGNISAQVELLIASMQTQAEAEAKRMKENEKLLSMITHHSDRVVCLYDVKRRSSRVWNPEICKNCQIPPPRLCEATAEKVLENAVFTPEGKDALRQMFRNIDDGMGSGNIKLSAYAKTGELRWYDIQFSTICNDNGQPETALLSYKDVTQQHEHEMAYLRQFQSLSETEYSLGLMEVDVTADRIELQDSLFAPIKSSGVGSSLADFAEQMITLKMEEAYWNEARMFFSSDFMIRQYEFGNRLLNRTWPMTFHSGRTGWVRFDVELIADSYTGHIRAYFRVWDVTTIREKQLELKNRSERDGMTGLYNRSTAEELIREKLADGTAQGIFMILDLDQLKVINDSYGHSAGDKAIISVAQIMKKHFRSGDILGRIGGDEFVVYMPGAAKNREVISGTITELLRKLDSLFADEHEEMGITCSVGCVVAQKDSTYESLYQQADKALYHVKKSGRNNFAFYFPEMEEETFVYRTDKLFSLDHAKRSESGEVQHLLTALSDYYHLVLACNITENSYHLMQEVQNGIFAQFPTFGKVDTMVSLSMMRMTPEDAQRFEQSMSRHALLEADAQGEKHVTVYFDFQDLNGTYKPAECTSILYRNAMGDLCGFALIRWRSL